MAPRMRRPGKRTWKVRLDPRLTPLPCTSTPRAAPIPRAIRHVYEYRARHRPIQLDATACSTPLSGDHPADAGPTTGSDGWFPDSRHRPAQKGPPAGCAKGDGLRSQPNPAVRAVFLLFNAARTEVRGALYDTLQRLWLSSA